MERLGDIVDQDPELGDLKTSQIAMPPIQGAVRFEMCKFRFGSSGPFQMDGVKLRNSGWQFCGHRGPERQRQEHLDEAAATAV